MRASRVRWKDVGSLARLEAGASLVSQRLWLLRYWIPAGILCFVAAKVLRDHGLPRNYGELQAGGAQLASTLAYVYWGLAIVGAPIYVYSSLEESRRNGVEDALRTTPLPTAQILLAMLAGKLWVCAHFLLAALPVCFLAWQAGGITQPLGFLPIVAEGVTSMSFAGLLFAAGKSASGFGGWLLLFTLFPPATLPLRVWFPGVALYAAFHLFWPDAWLYYRLDDFVVSVAIPASRLQKMVEGTLSAAGCAGAFLGWALWTGLFVRSAMRAFRVERRRVTALQRPPAQRMAWKLPKVPPGSGDAAGRRRALPLSRLQVNERGLVSRHMYRLTGRNPFVYLALLGERRTSTAWDRWAAQWKLTASMAALGLLYMAFQAAATPRPAGLDFLVVIGTFIACHHAAEVLGARASEAETLLSSGVRERDVVLGAVGLAFLKAHPMLWFVGLYYLTSRGPGEAVASLFSSAAALLLASAFGAWSMVAGTRGMEKSFVAFGATLAVYLWLRSALGAASGPWNEALLGAVLGIIGMVLLLAFKVQFRRVVRSRA